MPDEPSDPFDAQIAETLRFCLEQHWAIDDPSELMALAADCARVDHFHLRLACDDPRAVRFGGTWIYEATEDGRIVSRPWLDTTDPYFDCAERLGAFGEIGDAGEWT